MSKDPVVIVAAKRTAIGNFIGQYSSLTAIDLGIVSSKACIKQSTLTNEQIDGCIIGCVLPAGLGQAPARQIAIRSGLASHTESTTINKMCGSGMKAIMYAHDNIILDNNNIMLAGGIESMTNAPFILKNARQGYKFGEQKIYDHMILDGLEDAYKQGQSMGIFAEQCADKFKFTREQQDAFAIESLRRAQNAATNGLFTDEIADVTITIKKQSLLINQDECPVKASVDKIPKLKPAFKQNGTITAANSSSISDGAASVILMRESTAKQQGIKPLAKILNHATYAQEPEWFTTAPIGAISTLLEKCSLKASDIDLFEINEAFACVTMATMQELNIPHNIVNINGGACALGHPVGASGARILTTLIYAMKKNNLKTGVASLCIGGGEATAMAIECY